MKKLVLHTFIDAFGWEVYKEHGFNINLKSDNQNYIKSARKLKTVFGFSSAADPSILTGKYPEEHTHWSSFFLFSQNITF